MNLPVSLKTIANVLGIVLLIALVAPFVVYAVPGVVGADHSFVVLTASMTPAIAPGDVVIVADRDPGTIADGDVITFVRGDNEVPVTHRVIDVVETSGGVSFETQGDANGAPDASPIPATNVIGVVTITIPYIGYVIQFADSPAGFIALIVVPFGLLALSEAWNLYNARRADDASVTASSGLATEADDTTATGDIDATETSDIDATETSEPAATEGFVVTNRTIEGALLVLVAVAPYAVYVAYTLRTTIAITVASAAIMTTLLTLALYAAGRSRDASDELAESIPEGTVNAGDPDDPDPLDVHAEDTAVRPDPSTADPTTDGGEWLERGLEESERRADELTATNSDEGPTNGPTADRLEEGV